MGCANAPGSRAGQRSGERAALAARPAETACQPLTA